MDYFDTLLYQGTDSDGIYDATSRLLAVIHGINRASGIPGDEHKQKGNYPLGIAFPKWQTPTISANKPLSNGTTGPILRVFGPVHLLEEIRNHTLMQSLIMEGRALPYEILAIPKEIKKWVSYYRYHRIEKKLSGSYSRRCALRKQKVANKENVQSTKTSKSAIPKIDSYVYLRIIRKQGNSVLLPVCQKFYLEKNNKNELLRFNSWGLTTDGVLPYF